MGKMKCHLKTTKDVAEKDLSIEQRTEVISGETEGSLDQDANHSVQSTHVQLKSDKATTNQESRRLRVKWHKANETKLWESFDVDVDKLLETTLAGTAEWKIQVILIHSVGTDRFGEHQGGSRGKAEGNPNRRQRDIKNIRKQLRDLKKQWKNAHSEEKKGLAALRKSLRDKLNPLCRAEALNKKRKKRRKQSTAFIANPYQYASRMLGQARNGILNCSKEEHEAHHS